MSMYKVTFKAGNPAIETWDSLNVGALSDAGYGMPIEWREMFHQMERMAICETTKPGTSFEIIKDYPLYQPE